MSLSAPLRALLRIEHRDLLRHRGRSALVLALVAVPVAAIVGGGALQQMTEPTAVERATHGMGAADLLVKLADAGALEQTTALLPANAWSVVLRAGAARVSVPGLKLAARGVALPPDALLHGGLARGMWVLHSGEWPTRNDQVALSPGLMASLDRQLGDSVETDLGPASICGLFVDPENLQLPLVLHAEDSTWSELAIGRPPRALLVSLSEGSAAGVSEVLRAAGLALTERAQLEEPDPLLLLLVLVVGGFGFFEATLVIAAAFAVGVRRRQRDLGLSASCGAERSHLRLALLLSVGTLATLGALVGVLLGLLTAAALHPQLDDWNGRLNGPFEISPGFVGSAVVLGLLAALLAAALPTASATRLPIRVALSGRRPPSGSSGRGSLSGALIIGGGLMSMLLGARQHGPLAGGLVLLGSLGGLLGLGLCCPWLLGALARLAAPLPLSWRLAVRDAGRFRSRNGPVVTAVLAGMAISVLVASLVTSVERLSSASAPGLRDDQILIEGPGAESLALQISQQLGALAVAPMAAVCRAGEPLRGKPFGAEAGETWLAWADDALIQVLDASPADAALRDGRVVAMSAQPLADVVSLLDANGRAVAELPSHSQVPTQPLREPVLLLGERRARALQFEPGPPPGRQLVPWLLRLPRPLDAAQLALASRLASGSPGQVIDAALLHDDPARGFPRVVLAICVLTGLIIIAAATALTSVESAADGRVLQVVGAAPALLASHLAARAAWLALLGCALAVPAGLIPAVGLLTLANPGVDLALVLPWGQVLAALLVLPCLTYAGAWSLARLHTR